MSFQTKWNDYSVPPLGASLAIILPFYGFQVKSMQQLGETVPQFVIKKALMDGVKSAPNTGMIVGAQLLGLELFKKMFDQQTPLTLAISAIGAGVLSAPFQAGFNAQTFGLSPFEAIKKLTLKQTGAITLRETSFLFSLEINEYVEEKIKKILGDHPAVGYATAFTSGATGAIVGHPADTLLTQWQGAKKIDPWKLMKGWRARALAVGGFALCYKFAKEMLTIKQK